MTRYLSILLSIWLIHMIVVIRHFHASNTEQLPYNLICLLCQGIFPKFHRVGIGRWGRQGYLRYVHKLTAI
jgi:hypothetical protein